MKATGHGAAPFVGAQFSYRPVALTFVVLVAFGYGFYKGDQGAVDSANPTYTETQQELQRQFDLNHALKSTVQKYREELGRMKKRMHHK